MKKGQTKEEEMFSNSKYSFVVVYFFVLSSLNNSDLTFFIHLSLLHHLLISLFSQATTSPNFEEILSFLGEKIELKGFTGYSGDLETTFTALLCPKRHSVFLSQQKSSWRL